MALVSSLLTRSLVPLALPLLLMVGCASGNGPRSSVITTAPDGTGSPRPTTPTTSTGPPPTTSRPMSVPTTAYSPVALQASPDAAAAALIDAWATGNRPEAVSVATPAARQALFAGPYPAGQIEARGCTAASTSPGTCTYADLATGTLYEIGVLHLAGGWYVSSVTVES